MSLKTKLEIDVLAFVGYLAATNTVLTGIPIHEWLSVGVALVLAVHTALNWDWTVNVVRYFFRRLFNISRFNLVLDVLLFVAFTAVMVSGFLVSRVVVPLLGISVPFGPTWRILHSLSAKIMLPILGIHVGLHWRWLVHAFRRVFAPAPAAVVAAETVEARR